MKGKKQSRRGDLRRQTHTAAAPSTIHTQVAISTAAAAETWGEETAAAAAALHVFLFSAFHHHQCSHYFLEALLKQRSF